jgi:hypothetical protein
VIEYCFKGKGALPGWPVITAEPGEVRTNMHTFETVGEIEEYIETLRRAAKETHLPDGSGEAKSA